MANDPQTLTLNPSTWGEESARWLSTATGADTLADIAGQVQSGAATLFNIHQGEAVVGAFVLRVDNTATGPQGVIVAAAAKLQGVDMLATCLPSIEGMFKGCKSIRYHTNRPALARRMAAQGYRAAEIVSIKEI